MASAKALEFLCKAAFFYAFWIKARFLHGSVTWALIPYNEQDVNIWIKDIKNRRKRMVRYLVSPIFFLITMLHHFIFLALNGFKFKKYILYRFKSGIIAVPNNKLLSNKDVKFELSSLFGLYTSELL